MNLIGQKFKKPNKTQKPPIKPGLAKARVFSKKPSPGGFFLGFIGFFGFYWVF
jgi:hypothetical protein